MIGRAKTAAKFFTYGLLVGVFFAPRSGAETRTMAIDWVSKTVKGTIGMRG
ncbi:MAG: YtxH domain-containing protein [Thermomicrobiales bacterium]